MNGNLMYAMATQRLAEQRRSARQAGEAQRQRAAARGRHAKNAAPEETAVPVIPDFAHEMFDAAAPDAVPAPRPEATRGRHTRTGR